MMWPCVYMYTAILINTNNPHLRILSSIAGKICAVLQVSAVTMACVDYITSFR
jgi:hypothetical protein